MSKLRHWSWEGEMEGVTDNAGGQQREWRGLGNVVVVGREQAGGEAEKGLGLEEGKKKHVRAETGKETRRERWVSRVRKK